MMFVSALFPSRLQATVFRIYASGGPFNPVLRPGSENTLFKTAPEGTLHHMKRLRLPSPAEGGRPDVFSRGPSCTSGRQEPSFWGPPSSCGSLNTYPRPEEGTAPNAAAAMEHSYAGQIGHWMEPVTQVAGFDWKINSALLGAFCGQGKS